MEYIVTVVLGAVCIVIGILNRKGNVSMLHSYHRNRVSEENRIPFGKLVGLGTIIIGVALMVFGGLSYLSAVLQNEGCAMAGKAVMIVGALVGAGISFYAMKKYNGGIF